MTASDSPDTDLPGAPSLVAPRDASAVNGREVTFVWDAVEGAATYRLQVAPTARFEDPVLDEEVGAQTAVTVGNQFPVDGTTFFWRVRAGTGEAWGTPSAVESFVAETAEEAEPQWEKETQTITGLARAARREVTRRVFQGDDRFEREKERGVAYEGVAAGQIMGISVAILSVILVAVVVLFGWYGQVVQQTEASASTPQNYERLQQAEREATQTLNEYGVVDEEEEVYRIPIDQAMDIVVNEEYQQEEAASGDAASGEE